MSFHDTDWIPFFITLTSHICFCMTISIDPGFITPQNGLLLFKYPVGMFSCPLKTSNSSTFRNRQLMASNLTRISGILKSRMNCIIADIEIKTSRKMNLWQTSTCSRISDLSNNLLSLFFTSSSWSIFTLCWRTTMGDSILNLAKG